MALQEAVVLILQGVTPEESVQKVQHAANTPLVSAAVVLLLNKNTDEVVDMTDPALKLQYTDDPEGAEFASKILLSQKVVSGEVSNLIPPPKTEAVFPETLVLVKFTARLFPDLEDRV